MADTTKMQLMVAVIVLQVLLANIPKAQGRPGSLYERALSNSPAGCTENSSTEELCQQCAKHTKSNVVYPMCCEDQEAARDFCFRYINFGLQ